MTSHGSVFFSIVFLRVATGCGGIAAEPGNPSPSTTDGDASAEQGRRTGVASPAGPGKTDFDGGARTGNGPSSAKPTCDYPTVVNDVHCPAQFSMTTCVYDAPCPKEGLHCEYPGSGDGTADGCYATAVMDCRTETRLPAGDAGLDASATRTTWICGQ